ncbi:hypothetical protein DSOL_3987 [Desulfosporosinus metallidurans]|uniref:Uncharacterized protein n=1 Tax=Desulfosporosinus metallidurans TaxID=1888891 RepID=A0A1Q8QMQ4_9FIRM|nr:hypothetical protein DSOL_3987 [Desulfosporosinus metallidurans]
MRALTDAMTIPVTKVADRVLVGFSQTEFEQAFQSYRSGIFL